MAKKSITLYIDDTSLRLLVTAGKKIKKWAELALDPDLVKGAVQNEAEIATRIRQLFVAQKISDRRIIVGLSGLHALTRPITLPQLPGAMVGEAVIREAKRLLPVPPEQLYISWQILPGDQKDKMQVFLTAVPRKTADALLRTLRQAGFDPYLMDVKPLALTRLVKEKTAIIVDVQPSEFDIVIMNEGIPQPVRTVPLPSEAVSWQDKLPIIIRDLDRTIKFYNTNNPEKPLDTKTPLYVSGELADRTELFQSLSDEIGHTVLLLSLPFKCPEKLVPSHYMVNMGLALKEQSNNCSSLVNINTLPEAYKPKRISPARLIAIPSAAAIVALLASLVMLLQGASANIDSMRDRLDNTTRLLQQRQQEKNELRNKITELEKQIAEVDSLNNTFEMALTSIYSAQDVVNGDLRAATGLVSNSISLSSISHDDDILTVKGNAPTEADVLAYASNLDNTERFVETIVSDMTSVEEESGGGVDFSLILKIK
jgi:type IV pilus assembly protein PilM